MNATNLLDLRPLTVGQILDRAIRLYRNNFLKFIGIISLSQVPASLFAILVTTFVNEDAAVLDPTAIGQNLLSLAGLGFGIGLIVTLIGFVLTQMSTAALTEAISANYLGEQLGIVESYKRIGRSWVSLIGALFMGGLVTVGLAVPLMIPCINIVLALPLVGAIVYLSQVVVQLVPPIVVLERQNARKSIYRAWHLARKRFWPTLGFMLALGLLAFLLVGGPTFLIIVLLDTVLSLSPTTANLIDQIVTLLLNIIVLPLQLTSITLLYFDLRVRAEGFDLKLMAAQTDSVENPVNRDILAAGEPETSFSPTGQEIGYFCLISLGVAALFGVFYLASLTLLGGL